MLACEEKIQTKVAPPETWFDNPSVERDYFGLDHCDLGGRMAANWNFMPSFIDVLLHHHKPEEADHDMALVQVVGAVEHFLLIKAQELGRSEIPQTPGERQASEIDPSQFADRSSQAFDDSEWQDISKDLDIEYNRLLPDVERGVASVISHG